MRAYDQLAWTFRDGMRRYIEGRVKPGSFLQAVLENDLMAASGRADDDMTFGELRELLAWIHHEAPSDCHGSPEKVRAWIRARPRVTELVKFGVQVAHGVDPALAGQALRDGES